MITNKPFEPSNNFADQAAQSADEAIKSTQRVANETLDGLASGVQSLRDQTAPLLNRATEQASEIAQRGLDAVRNSAEQMREKAQQASISTVSYIKEEPLKSILIAAATGAALMALVSLVSHSRNRV